MNDRPPDKYTCHMCGWTRTVRKWEQIEPIARDHERLHEMADGGCSEARAVVRGMRAAVTRRARAEFRARQLAIEAVARGKNDEDQ